VAVQKHKVQVPSLNLGAGSTKFGQSFTNYDVSPLQRSRDTAQKRVGVFQQHKDSRSMQHGSVSNDQMTIVKSQVSKQIPLLSKPDSPETMLDYQE
jgi:hypothetical protein